MPPKKKKEILVLGGGPAGLMAAIAAARNGAKVTLLERMPEPGLKLCATGGGRCNVTNTLENSAFMEKLGRQGRFAEPALSVMGSVQLREFLASIGVPTHAADGFHVYPVSENATQIRDALQAEVLRCKVKLLTNMQVVELIRSGERVSGIKLSKGSMAADAVIIATGSCGYPALGGNDSGYALARSVGHMMSPLAPSLVPIITRERWPGELAGVSLTDVRVWIELPGHSREGLRGDLLFTHNGISGPAVLDMSGAIARLLTKQFAIPMRIDLLPKETMEQTLARFAAWRTRAGKKMVGNLLAEEVGLPHSFAKQLLLLAGAEPEVIAAELPAAVRDQLVGLLHSLLLTARDTEGFKRAMVVRGGIALRDITSETLESEKLWGLYFAGEVLDIDGPCGGYNLQWAFASGWLAGLAAAGALPK
ncbi:MAG: aminoacetone oxidase family FAD-binding enzyme [Kiritimatiellaeota bacterium]|nr:aminoacetone oxidase family FAD-binding enzyme [Kiritimatiellota bacterium]